ETVLGAGTVRFQRDDALIALGPDLVHDAVRPGVVVVARELVRVVAAVARFSLSVAAALEYFAIFRQRLAVERRHFLWPVPGLQLDGNDLQAKPGRRYS